MSKGHILPNFYFLGSILQNLPSTMLCFRTLRRIPEYYRIPGNSTRTSHYRMRHRQCRRFCARSKDIVLTADFRRPAVLVVGGGVVGVHVAPVIGEERRGGRNGALVVGGEGDGGKKVGWAVATKLMIALWHTLLDSITRFVRIPTLLFRTLLRIPSGFYRIPGNSTRTSRYRNGPPIFAFAPGIQKSCMMMLILVLSWVVVKDVVVAMFLCAMVAEYIQSCMMIPNFVLQARSQSQILYC